jgi:hypothetical protein
MPVLRCYVLGGGGLRAWYLAQPPEVRAAIYSTLEVLEVERDWRQHPQYRDLRGACAGLGEIKIDLDSGHFRILVFHGPYRDEVTLLSGFQKTKGNKEYGAACWAANQRKSGVITDSRRAIVFSLK